MQREVYFTIDACISHNRILGEPLVTWSKRGNKSLCLIVAEEVS